MKKKPTLVQEGPIFTTAGLVHRVLPPSSPGPHPTAVMIHGRSGNEDVMWVFSRAIPDHWLQVAPRAIEADPEEASAEGYSWHLPGTAGWPTLSQFDDAVTAVAHFIHTLPHLYDADPQHIYLMGFSQGAATAYATAIHHPGLVQGIAGLVGFMPTHTEAALKTKPLANLPIFMAVGKQDAFIPYAQAKACAQTLRAAQAQLTYHEYDTGHKLTTQGVRDLTQWWAERPV